LQRAVSTPPAVSAGRGYLPGAGQKKNKKLETAKLAPRPLDAAETRNAGLYQRFLCDDKPAAGDVEAWEQRAAIEYARGALYFSANHFQEAAVIFREVALRRAETKGAIFATQLYLEALNVIGMLGTTAAPSCYDDMARDVPAFIGLYCKDGREKAHAEQCDTLQRIERDIARLGAERLIREAEAGKGDAAAAYMAGAERYVQIWEEHGRGPCEARQATCERMEEVLYNASRAYQAARDITKAIATRVVLINPRYNLHTTELGKRSLYEIGSLYQSIAIYDEAATWYERYAQASPRMEKAPEALQDAIVLRLALGQVEAATKDADRFSKNYGSWKPADTARVHFAVALHLLDHDQPEAARKRLSEAMPAIDKSATIAVQILAHVGLGRALMRLGKGKEAAAEHRQVLAHFRGATALLAKMQGTDDLAELRTYGKVLTAVSESMFFFAEEKRRAAEALRLPAYAGSGRREDVVTHTQTTLANAIAARRKAIDEAEKAYLEVLALQPFPPPRWVVASAARVARMHGLLAAEIRATSAPRSWKKQGASPWGSSWEEIRAAWADALDEASEPERLRAKGAYRRCVDLSVKFQHFDAFAQSCGAWLTRHYPAEYPRIDEIADRPTRMSAGSGIEGAPVPEP